MTRIKSLSLALILAGLAVPSAAAGTLTVTLEGIKKTEGEIKIGVYDAETYSSGAAITGATVSVDEARETVTIEGLEPGEYGLKMFHDVNADGEMNTNPFGKPTEP